MGFTCTILCRDNKGELFFPENLGGDPEEFVDILEAKDYVVKQNLRLFQIIELKI